jgi:hypothetical protein
MTINHIICISPPKKLGQKTHTFCTPPHYATTPKNLERKSLPAYPHHPYNPTPDLENK